MRGSSMTALPPEDLLGSTAPPQEEEEELPVTTASTPSTMVSTTKKSVAGQFEDADDEEDEDQQDTTCGEVASAPTTDDSTNKPTNALAWLAAAAERSSPQETTNNKEESLAAAVAAPAPSRLQRRISANTSNATSALLEMAGAKPERERGVSPAIKKSVKKKKTFVVRLEEIREYKDRHGSMNLENPTITEAWEQNLWTWLYDCRKQYRAGMLSDEKAKALHNAGCEGFAVPQDEEDPDELARRHEQAEEEQGYVDEARHKALEARHKQEQARRLEAHMMRERMLEQEHRLLEQEQRLLEQQPDAHAHPALRALWLQRQEEARRIQQMQAAGLLPASLGPGLAGMGAAAAAARNRRASLDPDGTTTSDSDVYPTESSLGMSAAARMAAAAHPNLPLSHDMHHAVHAQQEARVLEEMYAREALAREALIREQRLAAALRMGGPGGMGGFGAGAGLHHNPALLHQGRVMSLLQPVESVPSRATDSYLGAAMGGYHPDPRVNAMLRAQLMEQQHRHASEAGLFRRPSDASGSALGAEGTAPGSNPELAAAAEHAEGAAAEVTTTSVGKSRKSWDERMKEMWNFFLTHGHTQVQTRGEYKELGRWLSSVRCRMRDGLLPQHHVKEFLAMQEWAVDDDGAPIGGKHHGEDGGSVGSNKSSRRNSAATAVSDDAVPGEVSLSKAAAAKAGNKTKRALPKSWNQSFIELQAFKARFGHADVKMIGSSPYGLLGKWLASQRSRHKLGQLPEDKVRRLRGLGCAGFGRKEAGFESEEPYRSQYRQDDEEAEFDAAIRRLKAAKERSAMIEAAMADESADATPTNSPPLSPAAKEKRVRHSYETRLEHIKAFKEKHGHCKIRLGSADKHEELLARWLASARSRYRGGQFKEERAAELRALGCDGFEPLESVPSSAADMEVERVVKKRDAPARTATPSPTPSLEAEDGSEPASKKQRASAKRQSFEDMLKELESYQYVFGVGCSVPKPDGEKGKLGRWLAFQRRQFIAGKLSADRVEKLKAIGRKEFSETALLVRAAEMSAAGSVDQ